MVADLKCIDGPCKQIIFSSFSFGLSLSASLLFIWLKWLITQQLWDSSLWLSSHRFLGKELKLGEILAPAESGSPQKALFWEAFLPSNVLQALTHGYKCVQTKHQHSLQCLTLSVCLSKRWNILQPLVSWLILHDQWACVINGFLGRVFPHKQHEKLSDYSTRKIWTTYQFCFWLCYYYCVIICLKGIYVIFNLSSTNFHNL